MTNDIISFALSLVVAYLVVFPLGSQLKRHPGVFYAVAGVLVGLYAYYQYGGLYGNHVLQLVAEPLRKGYIASFFLAAVMFCGTMATQSKLRMHLLPIRAELSILSLIMYTPHIVAFLPAYLPRFTTLVEAGNLISYSIIVALVLTVLYVLLSLFSLRVFRARMPYKIWKGIQRLSYAMVALLGIHIWLVLGRAALRGDAPDTTVSLTLYTVIIIAYAVLRVRRALIDHKGKEGVVCCAECAS